MPADPDAGDARSGFLPLVGNESSSPVMQRNEKFLPRVPTALGFFLLLSASPGSRNFEVHSASIINFFFFLQVLWHTLDMWQTDTNPTPHATDFHAHAYLR